MDIRRKSLREIVLAVCFFILIPPKILFAWTTPVNISNTTGHSNYASLAVDRNGYIHVVWTDDTSGNNEILYCFFDGESWYPPVNISNDSTDSDWANVIVGFSDHPHIAWTDYTSGEIYWAFNNGSSWSEPVDISNTSGPSFCPQLATDSTDKVYVVWHDMTSGDSDIYFSSYDGTSWSPPQNVTNDAVSSAYPNIAVDSKGCVHLVWMDYGDLDIHYSKYDGDAWTSPVNISNLVGQSCGPKIVLDSQDHPYVVWEERHGGYRVYFTHYDGSHWTVPYKLSQTNSYRPALALDSGDRGHVVWGGASNEIYYTFGSDTSWFVPIDIADSSGRNCLCPDIAIDSTHIHVVWTKAIDRDRFEIYYSSHKLSGLKPERCRPFQSGYKLEQCYPNPFNANTAISYQLSAVRPHHTTLKVYNILGQEVKTLADEEQQAGYYQVLWDGRDRGGKEVSSGIYFCRLEVKGDKLKVIRARKLLLLR